jgi:threonine dehydrogenase-like Zn-dependent dehydrogenase
VEVDVAETCRAVVFTGDGSHEIREFPIPDPPDGGALLQVEAVGLCGSDVAQHAGVQLIPGTSAFPVVPGHETVGRVTRLGRGADLGVAEGDRVAVDEVLRQVPPLAVYGYTMPVTDDGGGLFGGYGEYMVVLPGTRLHRLRDDRPAAELTVFEPMANAVNWVEIAGVREGQTVVVEGPGHQGLAVLQAVLAAGAGTAIVTGTGADGLRLDAARAIGAHEVIDVTSVDAVTRVRELTNGRMADVVMDISPAVATVPLAVDLVAFRGTVLLAGLKHFAPVDGLVSDKIVLQGLSVFGGSGYTPASMAKAVDLINTGAVDVGHLRGEVFGLDAIDEALGLLARTLPGRDAVRVSIEHTSA